MPGKASDIRILISDVDGVWTSGSILYLSDGREMKQFNVRDGLAVKLAQNAGLIIAVITSRQSDALQRRCRELGIDHLIQGAGNKLDEAATLLESLGLGFEQACYIGDDLPDLATLGAAALSAAPSDACAEVLEAVDWRLETSGGRGAFRELVERLLRERGDWDQIVKGFKGGTLSSSKV
ncbi:MAG TPA: HAD-IIIA family hydrolase [Thermoanaerobaculia bacterium]|nr:HAD-IIIA family hydrolase [Thermoanaerobaculia bacterium]